MAAEVVIALGSNLGNRARNVIDGLHMLRDAGLQVFRHSCLYESAAAYVTEQPSFLNAAVLARTQLQPLQLLHCLKEMEAQAGRESGGQRWGPRPLDLDIIFYGDVELQHERLTIPHPRWAERPFVMAPASDLLHDHDMEEPEGQPRGAGSGAGSVIRRLRQLHQHWQQAGGEQLVGGVELRRVTPVGPHLMHWGRRTYVMGVINATPDSFSDGGRLTDAAQALEAARQLVRDGADLLDVGGQSTRPGAARVPAEEEAERVLPVIRALRGDGELAGVPLSVDTFDADVAAEAVAAGADMVNDVSGGSLDPRMLPKVAELRVPFVLMHMRGDPGTMQSVQHTSYRCVWRDVGDELQQAAERAVAAGVAAWNLVLDPGLGFAKTSEGNLDILRHLADMRGQALQGAFRRGPMLLGPSRKGFLGKLTGRGVPQDRDHATAAAAAACVAGGADIIRAHNVRGAADAVRVADAVWRGLQDDPRGSHGGRHLERTQDDPRGSHGGRRLEGTAG